MTNPLKIAQDEMNKASKEFKEDEWKRPMETLTKAMTMKKHMLAKGLTRAKAKCPYCEGYWHGVLCGHKKHLHMACDGDCKAMMME